MRISQMAKWVVISQMVEWEITSKIVKWVVISRAGWKGLAGGLVGGSAAVRRVSRGSAAETLLSRMVK